MPPKVAAPTTPVTSQAATNDDPLVDRYTCPLCDKDYCAESEVKNHFKKVHNQIKLSDWDSTYQIQVTIVQKPQKNYPSLKANRLKRMAADGQLKKSAQKLSKTVAPDQDSGVHEPCVTTNSELGENRRERRKVFLERLNQELDIACSRQNGHLQCRGDANEESDLEEATDGPDQSSDDNPSAATPRRTTYNHVKMQAKESATPFSGGGQLRATESQDSASWVLRYQAVYEGLSWTGRLQSLSPMTKIGSISAHTLAEGKNQKKNIEESSADRILRGQLTVWRLGARQILDIAVAVFHNDNTDDQKLIDTLTRTNHKLGPEVAVPLQDLGRQMAFVGRRAVGLVARTSWTLLAIVASSKVFQDEIHHAEAGDWNSYEAAMVEEERNLEKLAKDKTLDWESLLKPLDIGGRSSGGEVPQQ